MFYQSVKESAVLRVASLAIAILPLLTTKTAAMSKTFHLSLTGEEGTTFEGSCTLETDDGTTNLPLSGTVPHNRKISANALKCRLESDGKLIVDVQHEGSHTRSAANGGTVNLSFH